MVCEWSKYLDVSDICSTVLILVLMEYGLREIVELLNTAVKRAVLILVLMEYGLRANCRFNIYKTKAYVLILVLMEYGLRGSNL